MLVKFLKPHPGFAYFEGDDADLSPEMVQKLIPAGFVILFPGVEVKEDEEPPKKKFIPKTR